MSKKKGRRHSSPQPYPANVYVPLPTARLLQEGLRTFERLLWQKPDNVPNVPFAKEVVSRLKTKLEDMLQREEWEKETPFDYNEIQILYAGIHIYLLNALISRQDEVLLPCLALCRQFGQLVEDVDVKQVKG